MEYSSFSSGTERAVKTWQVSYSFPSFYSTFFIFKQTNPKTLALLNPVFVFQPLTLIVSISNCFVHQATLGESENGVMTSELLERLFMEQQIKASGLKVNTDPEANAAISPPKVYSRIDMFNLRLNGC